jgi:hypothetical protein
LSPYGFSISLDRLLLLELQQPKQTMNELSKRTMTAARVIQMALPKDAVAFVLSLTLFLRMAKRAKSITMATRAMRNAMKARNEEKRYPSRSEHSATKNAKKATPAAIGWRMRAPVRLLMLSLSYGQVLRAPLAPETAYLIVELEHPELSAYESQ